MARFEACSKSAISLINWHEPVLYVDAPHFVLGFDFLNPDYPKIAELTEQAKTLSIQLLRYMQRTAKNLAMLISGFLSSL